MPSQWAGRIAGQSVHFRGTSTVGAQAFNSVTGNRPFSNRALTKAVYVARVTGGVSGTFGISVIGTIGMHGTALLPNANLAGTTVLIAGATTIAAAGTFVLVPYNYGIDGKGFVGTTATTPIYQGIDQAVPPAYVAFESNIATVGISAHIVVNALMMTS